MSSENLWILKDRYLIEKPICDRLGFLCSKGKGQSIKNCIGLMMSVQNLPEKDQIFSVFRLENA